MTGYTWGKGYYRMMVLYLFARVSAAASATAVASAGGGRSAAWYT